MLQQIFLAFLSAETNKLASFKARKKFIQTN